MRRFNRLQLTMLLLVAGSSGDSWLAWADKPSGGGGNRPPADPAIVCGRSGDLVVMNADGSNQTTVFVGGASMPSWSPGGDRVVFRRNDGLWSVDVTIENGVPVGRNAAWLVGTTPADFDPQWSPLGDQILFCRVDDFDPRGEMLVVPVGGGAPSVVYTPPPGYAVSYCAWKPDGSAIAFIEFGPDAWFGVNEYAIKVLDLATQQVTTCFGPQPYYLQSLDWAHTQDAVAFTLDATETGDLRQVFTLSLQSGSVPQFIADGSFPSWSPDDSKLVMGVGRVGGRSALSVFDLVTGQTTRLANGGQPDWREAP